MHFPTAAEQLRLLLRLFNIYTWLPTWHCDIAGVSFFLPHNRSANIDVCVKRGFLSSLLAAGFDTSSQCQSVVLHIFVF